MVTANVGVSFVLLGYVFAINGCVYLALIDIDTHLLPWADCIVVGVISCSLLGIDVIIHRQFNVVATMAMSASVTWVIFRYLELVETLY